MKKLLGLVFGVLLGLVIVSPVQAKVMIKEKGTVSVAPTEIINDDLFIGAETADIAGTVNGDIYVGAGTIKFSGRVSGDLVVGAGTVIIDQAVIGDSLIVGAGTVTIDDQTRIGGSLLAGSGTIDNQARVGRNFFAGAGNINLNAPVGGEARFGTGKLAFGPKTMINGDLTYTSEEELDQDQLAMVRGKVTRHEAPEFKRLNDQKIKAQLARGWLFARWGFHVFSFFGSLIVGLVMLWLLGKPTLAIGDKIVTKFGSSLGWGFVLLFITPPALMLLMFTGVGLPLAFILGGLFVIDLYLAKIFAGMALGKVLARQFDWKLKPAPVFIVGLIAYYLLRLIPVVSFFVRLIALLAGLGGVWLYKQQLLGKKRA